MSLLDMDDQCMHKLYALKSSGFSLFDYRMSIEIWIKLKITIQQSKIGNGIVQLIRIERSNQILKMG